MPSRPFGSVAYILLAALISFPYASAQEPQPDNAIKQQITALPSKAHIAVHLKSGTSVAGRLVSHGEDDFVMRQDRGNGTQTIAFQQVQSVEQIKAKHSKAKWIILGTVGGTLIVLAAVAVHIAHHPLG